MGHSQPTKGFIMQHLTDTFQCFADLDEIDPCGSINDHLEELSCCSDSDDIVDPAPEVNNVIKFISRTRENKYIPRKEWQKHLKKAA